MQNHFIHYLFTNQTIQVLFWTLIHSLWQGIVFAFFTAIILMSTKKSATALRYKLLGSVLMLFFITSAFTFCYEAFSIVNYTAEPYKPVVAIPGAVVAVNNHPASIIEKLISFLQSCENWIILTWFAVIAIKCVGLVKGLRDVCVLKRRQVFNAGEYWNNRLQVLAESTGIKKQILLLKSAIAKVPMVVGYVKPVILFPAAALTALAPEEIEAILLHELAHIRRKDYLINIFQRIAEIIFFFNPAVLWISSLIKEERENCCDDIAVKQTKNKKQFIHALVSFQEYNASGYTASFSGKKNFLLNRIKRILTNNNQTLNTMEKTFLLAGIVVTALTAFAFSQHKQSSFKNISPKKTIQIAINKKDTVPQKTGDDETYTFSSTVNGRRYKLVEVNGKVTEFYADNVKVPDDKISDYNDIVKELKKNIEMVKQHRYADAEAQTEELKAQIAATEVHKLAIDSQNINVENIGAKSRELQNVIAISKMQNDSNKIEALKAEAGLLQLKVLAANDLNNKVASAKLEALKATETNLQKETTELQIEKLAALQNVTIESKPQLEKLAAIEKEQKAIQDKQTKIIKDKTEKIINVELQKQIEQLKQQNKELKQQLREKTDSSPATPALP